jgi:putative addiction module CopG family antidote
MSKVIAMTVSMPPGLKAMVDERIASGEYTCVSEYIRELIRRDQPTRRKARAAPPPKVTSEQDAAEKAKRSQESFDRFYREVFSLDTDQDELGL